jgi:hypothetical protein
VSFLPVVGTNEEAAVAGYLSAGSRAAARATTKTGCEERVSCRAGYQLDDTSSSPARPPNVLSRPSMTKARTTFRPRPFLSHQVQDRLLPLE